MKPSASSVPELPNCELFKCLVEAGVDEQTMIAASKEWLFQGRLAQLPIFSRDDWRSWVIMGGRGSGKTRAGAEWISGMAQGLAPFSDKACGNIALVGETLADVREVMVEGPSGFFGFPFATTTVGKHEATTGLGERGGRVLLFIRRSGQFARAAIFCRMV